MLIILRGPAASGKDTYARELRESDPSIIIVNRDDIRFALYGVYFGHPIDEDFVTIVEHNAIRRGLQHGYNVISSNTNLSPKIANSIAHIGYAEGEDVLLIDTFKDVPLATLLERNAARERHVPEDVVTQQWQRAQKKYTLPEAPKKFEPYTGTIGKPDAVLCDLDGTAALMGDRSPYSENEYHKDTPNESVRHVLWGLANQGINILYVSARTENGRAGTEKWLNDHKFPTGVALIMRNNGDQRKDWIVKNELFDNVIAPNYNVLFAIDDRNQVVDAYRKRDLVVHQVADGEF